MLRGDGMRLEPFKDELSKFGQQFAEQGNIQGATFIYAVYQMADHALPKEHENLQVLLYYISGRICFMCYSTANCCKAGQTHRICSSHVMCRASILKPLQSSSIFWKTVDGD